MIEATGFVKSMFECLAAGCNQGHAKHDGTNITTTLKNFDVLSIGRELLLRLNAAHLGWMANAVLVKDEDNEKDSKVF